MPDVLRAVYADLKTVKTRSTCQLILEMPIEALTDVVGLLGAPLPGGEVWVAVARLREGVVSPDDVKQLRAPLGNAQKAGILCGDPVFRKYLSERSGKDVTDAEAAAVVVRFACSVKSRADLDSDKHGAELWRDLKAEYEAWKIAA
ncbi:MAG: hypothetical protein ABI216_21630 [Devosia sp.]